MATIQALPTTNTGINAEAATLTAILKKVNELVGAVNALTERVVKLEQRP